MSEGAMIFIWRVKISYESLAAIVLIIDKFQVSCYIDNWGYVAANPLLCLHQWPIQN